MLDEVSTLSPAAADATAAEVRLASVAFADVAAQVAAARDGLGGWRGIAEAGFADRVVELDRYLELVRWTAAAGAEAIEEYSRALGVVQGRLNAADAQAEDVARRLADPALDLAAFTSAWGEQARWAQSRAAVIAQFDAATETLADRLQALTRDVPDRPRSFGEHVTDAADVVADQVASSGYLALGWVWDLGGWWEAAAGVPGGLLEQARDPLGTVADALRVDDARAGRWGAVAGGLGAAAVGGGLGKALDGTVRELPGGPERPRGPNGRYLPQSFDEMLAGVDLVRMEGQAGAHTVARHVNVDDEFLKRRIQTGEVGGGGRGAVPRSRVASRWTDLDTAERVVTDVLRGREAEVREWLRHGRGPLVLDAPVAASAGVAWSRVGDAPTPSPVASVRVVLGRQGDGLPFVRTAYLVPA